VFQNPKVVKEFIHLYKKGMVKRWEPFSVYYKIHLQQAISLFELFYYANDFDTFYKVRNLPRHLPGNNTTIDTSVWTHSEKQRHVNAQQLLNGNRSIQAHTTAIYSGF
jgi:hypothetical protein